MHGFGIELALVVVILIACGIGSMCEAAERASYDESKVPPYTLPDPLVLSNGQKVTNAETWIDKRRPELFELFQEHVYGRVPGKIKETVYEVTSTDPMALGGKATRKTIRARFRGLTDKPSMEVVLYIPNAAKKPVPLFLGIHLFDKKDVRPKPGAPLLADIKHVPTGISPDRFPGEKTIEVILDRGYAIATIDGDDLSPDDAKRYLDGVLPLFWEKDQTARKPNDCGAIGAWAWGLSRALDFFASSSETEIDENRVIAIGHSRRGKTALWAGVQDERFAMIISNESGCGGAALSKRIFGETVQLINDRFPHWFCENFRKYNGKESDLPVDQHELIALIAPRPVYVGSAALDQWADPKGEFLACVGAEPVYRLLGKTGLGASEMPGLNAQTGTTIGYHVRGGKHALSDFDWMMYLDFADKQLKK